MADAALGRGPASGTLPTFRPCDGEVRGLGQGRLASRGRGEAARVCVRAGRGGRQLAIRVSFSSLVKGLSWARP